MGGMGGGEGKQGKRAGVERVCMRREEMEVK